jgi:protein TonB
VEGQKLPTMSQVAYLHPPVPRYPSNSRRAREEGLVLLAITIDENGRVVSVSVKKFSGHARLDEAATDAVTKAQFKPYSYGGVASAATAVIPIEFSLRGTAS